MDFALTTRWNASRHTDGEAMIEEILALGFEGVELGYDLRADLVPGVRRAAARGSVRIGSVHAFCPLPLAAGPVSPELFTPADPDPAVRRLAETHAANTVRFAAELGAGVVVLHAGRVPLRGGTARLKALHAAGRSMDMAYDRTLARLRRARDRVVRPVLDRVASFIERLLPLLEDAGVRLCIENLPDLEAVPAPREMRALLDRFPSAGLGYWHDIGHGQVRQHLGIGAHRPDLELLRDRLAGFHLHDVRPPATDHLMPPRGMLDFSAFLPQAGSRVLRVLEPAPKTPSDEVRRGLYILRGVLAGEPFVNQP